MSVLETQGERHPCPVCREMAEPTAWRPDSGYDPYMREFQCPRCRKVFYYAARTAKKLLAIDDRVRERRLWGELS